MKSKIKSILRFLGCLAFFWALFLQLPITTSANYTFDQQPAKSILENYQNPWGDAWVIKTSSNPDIPVAYSTCAWDNRVFAQEELAFISKLNSPFLFFDRCPKISPQSTMYRNLADQIHQANANIKVLGYHAAAVGGQAGAGQFLEPWFVHKKGTDATLSANRLLDAEGQPVVDITNADAQNSIANTIAQELAVLHLDGFLDDWVTVAPSCNCATSDIPDNVLQNWKSGMLQLMTKIRSAIGPDKLIIYNAFRLGQAEARDMDYHRQLLQIADGVWWEDMDYAGKYANMSYGGAEYQVVQQFLDMVQQMNRYAFFIVNAGYIYNYDQSTVQNQQALAKNYLAFYLNFFRGAKTPLIYMAPSLMHLTAPPLQINAYGGEAYFSSWDLKLGAPSGPAQELNPGVYRRMFANGEVWWNNGSQDFLVQVTPGYTNEKGQSASTVNLAAKDGAIFVKSNALVGFLVPPPTISSFTATPSTIISGSSTTLSWSVSNATGLSINQGIGTVTGSSKSVTPTQTTTYTLTATNSAGSVNKSVAVTVTAPPVSASTPPITTSTPPAATSTLPAVSPSGGSISPPAICQPRPACLDAVPHCLIAEPVGGWCPVILTSTSSLRLINDSGTYYLISNNQRLGITNPGMLYSYGFEFVDAVPASSSDLSLPLGSLLLPGNGSLVKSKEDPTVYLISNNQRHSFTSVNVFLSLGFKWDSVLTVTDPELQALPKADQLLNDPAAPHLPGIDILDNGTVYWLGFDLKKHGYPSLSVYNSWHKDGDFSAVVPVNAADGQIPEGKMVTTRVIQ